MTFCPNEDGTDTETRLVQCSLYDTTYRTVYVHSAGHVHARDFPIYDSHAFRAVRASDVILDGSIDVPFELFEYGGETFVTVNGDFVYMYVGDVDDTTWNAVDFGTWNAVLHDGALSADGCAIATPQSPPAPSSPPTHPPVYYPETNATACPNGPLAIEECTAAFVANGGTLPPNQNVPEISILADKASNAPTGCFDDSGVYEFNPHTSATPCSPTHPCICHDPENHTLPSPTQPPAPPLGKLYTTRTTLSLPNSHSNPLNHWGTRQDNGSWLCQLEGQMCRRAIKTSRAGSLSLSSTFSRPSWAKRFAFCQHLRMSSSFSPYAERGIRWPICHTVLYGIPLTYAARFSNVIHE